MHATAHSKVNRATRETKTKLPFLLNSKLPCLPSKVKRRCPAIMLAASRMAKVKGRITDLTDSIITITGIKGAGVPSGTKCDITELNW